MDLLNSVSVGVEMVKIAVGIFTEEKQRVSFFVKPFVLYPDTLNTPIKVELKEFTEACVKEKLDVAPIPLSCFVLAGETSVENPKTKQINHFFVVKLYMKDMEEGYVYSLPFSSELEIGKLRFVGSDANLYLPFTKHEGEGSSCNVIKMDTLAPYDYRAAFLIGHVNEPRLWIDVKVLISDMFCKLAPDEHHQYELIFEISKFGTMSPEMQAVYDGFKTFFDTQFLPLFCNITSEVKLENAHLA